MTIALLASSPAYSEASQIVPTINGLIQTLNSSVALNATTPTSWKNTVIGGDFSTNPWARGTSFTSISNTLTYTADRFWALGGASSSISVSQVTSSLPIGFAAVAKFGRAASNSDTAAIKFGQVFTNGNSVPYQATPFVLSFWAKAGANLSSASSVVGVVVGTGTGTNESAANYAAGSWTGYAGVTLTGSTGATATGVTVTTAWVRYSLAGFIPAAATQIGFNFSITGVGTAGSEDNVQLAGIQFEQMPQAGVTPSPFERRQPAIELDLCQHYAFVLNEGSGTGVVQGIGMVQGTTTAVFRINAPVTMRAAPTITIAAGTTWKIAKSSGVAQTATITASVASGDVNGATAIATADSASITAGAATFLLGGGGTGTITLSAEL